MPKRLFAFLVFVLPAYGQEPSQQIAGDNPEIRYSRDGHAEIPAPLSDGSATAPAPKPVPIAFEVKSGYSKRLHVVESPPMPGLPAPQGNIKVTVQLVEDPGLPEPPPPLPPLAPDDPAVGARLAELAKTYPRTRLGFVSATVYDHKRTQLRLHRDGGGDDGRKVLHAWSNLDFNHFCGFARFRFTGTDGEARVYGLMMGIGNQDLEATSRRFAELGREFHPPEMPVLPDLATSGPAFVVTGGDTTDKELFELLQGMHNLYQAEGNRMAEAYHARVKADAERRAYLIAHPPKPKDVDVQFWKRAPSRKETSNGGQP